MASPTSNSPAFLLIRSQIVDEERYERFRAVIIALAEQFQGSYLFRSDQVEAVHGSYPGGLLACMSFPSTQALRRFLASSEFRDLSEEMYVAGAQDVWVVPGA
jgi:uncharacterized protein (DUF1330 family)